MATQLNMSSKDVIASMGKNVSSPMRGVHFTNLTICDLYSDYFTLKQQQQQ